MALFTLPLLSLLLLSHERNNHDSAVQMFDICPLDLYRWVLPAAGD